MAEWGKAMRPTVHDLVEQANEIDEKVDSIETLPIVVIDYDTENDPITATVSKTYEELSTYTDCIVHDSYVNDVTLGTITSADDALQIVYGFSGIVIEEITYNTMTVTVESDNSAEIVIATDTFEINYDYVVGSATYTVNSNSWTRVQINNEIFNRALLLNGNEFNPYVFLVNTGATDRHAILYLQGKTSTNQLKFFGFYNTTVALNIEVSATTITSRDKHDFRLSPASTTQLGGVIIGDEFTVNNSGKFNLKTASATQLGGVKVGNGLSIDSAGVLSASGGTQPYLIEINHDSSASIYTLVTGTYAEIISNMNNIVITKFVVDNSFNYTFTNNIYFDQSNNELFIKIPENTMLQILSNNTIVVAQ